MRSVKIAASCLALLAVTQFTAGCGSSGNSNVVATSDTTGPVMSAPQYSSIVLTNQNVVVTISSTENVAAPTGWTKSGTGPYNFTKTYSLNSFEPVVFLDSVGNATTVNVTVANIDIVGPVVSAPQYSTILLTNQNVVVTITAAENLAAPSGWIKSGTGPFSYTKTYTNNTSESVVFTDAANNPTTVNVSISNIITDTTPNAFTFVDQANVGLSSIITSAPITVLGINAPAPISVTGGTYSINGGAFTAIAGTVNNGDTVRVQHTSAITNSTPINTVLTIGGVSDTFTTMTSA